MCFVTFDVGNSGGGDGGDGEGGCTFDISSLFAVITLMSWR